MAVAEAVKALLETAHPLHKRMWNARLAWSKKKHHYQLTPPGDWFYWLIMAGRGSGKTKQGANLLADFLVDGPSRVGAVVSKSIQSGKEDCLLGESGLLRVLNERGIPFDYNMTTGTTRLKHNNSTAFLYTAHEPDKLRGPNLGFAWLDETAAYKDAHLGDALYTTINSLEFALRAGDNPRCIVTTTPRNNKLMRYLIDHPRSVVTTGSTYDNAANLADKYLENIERYEGTRIGKQEIYGQLLVDVEGALWTSGQIDSDRIAPLKEDEEGERPWLAMFQRVIVGVDPPGGATECGIVTCGVVHPVGGKVACCDEKTTDNHFVVIRDSSLKGPPHEWSTTVADTYDEFSADLVVAEKNFGGDMVEATLKVAYPNLPVDMVHASKGKQVRAEPIRFLYEKHRVHHAGVLPKLEEEQTTWVPKGAVATIGAEATSQSPNRVDALVWALSELSQRRKRERGVISVSF